MGQSSEGTEDVVDQHERQEQSQKHDSEDRRPRSESELPGLGMTPVSRLLDAGPKQVLVCFGQAKNFKKILADLLVEFRCGLSIAGLVKGDHLVFRRHILRIFRFDLPD